MLKIMMWKLLIFTFIYGPFAHAFPDMIRHGYARCTTCHVAPSGGGALTPYGRALAKELVSTWGYEGEQEWHYGALSEEKTPTWLRVGGDYRALQSHYKDEIMAMGRFIEMQQQVEIGAQTDRWALSVQAGADTLQEGSRWYLPGYYLAVNLWEKLNVRVGKFIPRFGLRMPDHILSSRAGIGFGIQAERHTAEMIYTEEKFDVSLSVSQGELENGNPADAAFGQFNYLFTEKLQLGVSLGRHFKAQNNTMLGLSAMVGLSEYMYLLSDNVFQRRDVFGSSQNDFYHFLKLGYEIEKGVHVFILEDLRKQDLSADATTQNFYGLGFTFFPRPHIEIQGVWAKQNVLSRNVKNADYAWLLMHYYL